MIDGNNTKLTKIEEIGTWARNYFKHSFKEKNMAYNREDRQWLIDSMPGVISMEDN